MPAKGRTKPKDVLLIGGPTDDGAGVNVLRARDERVELGTLVPLREGKPIHGEVVKLTPRAEGSRLFDVETAVSSPAPRKQDTAALPRARPPDSGPTQVASDTYRRNWDAIWSRPSKRPN